MSDRPRSPEDEGDIYRRALRAGERTLWVIMAGVVVLTIVFSVVIMIDIGGGRANLADRLIIAVSSIVILGAVDTQATRLAQRRRPLFAPDPPGYRRFVIWSSLGLLAAAGMLLGLACYLP